MAEGGGPGRRAPTLRDWRNPARGRYLTDPLEHLPASRAGRVVRGRGATAPDRGGDPGAVCRRLRDDLRDPPRRQTGVGSVGETPWTVWAHAASRQDALHRLPPAAPRWHACRLQGPSVRLPRLHSRVGEVAQGQERGAANDGEDPLCPRAD